MIPNSTFPMNRFSIGLALAAAALIATTTVADEPNHEVAEMRLLHQLLASHPADVALKEKIAALAPKLESETSRLNASRVLTGGERQLMTMLKSATAVEHAAVAGDVESDSVEVTEPNPFTGLHDANDVPNNFASDEFVPLTYWGGTLNGDAIGVFSGYRPSDPSQGVVVVMSDKADLHGSFYDTPGTALRIVSVAQNRVTLAAASGRIEFDLNTKRFSAERRFTRSAAPRLR